MKSLTLHTLADTDRLVSPDEFHHLDHHSSALSLFTDFHDHEPLVIDAWARARRAHQYLLQTHGKMRLVVDASGAFIGTVAIDQLSESRILARVAKGETPDDVRVIDLMTPRKDILAVDYQDLRDATVGDVIETLRTNGERHCLVVDRETHQIRGLIAASDMAKRLHAPVELDPAPTFCQIVVALAH